MKPTWKQRDELAVLERTLKSLVIETTLTGKQIQTVVEQVRMAQAGPVTPRSISATTKQAFKVQLGMLIKDLIHARRWTHEEAANVLKTTRIRITKVCTGRIGTISMDALLDYLVRLGETVTITVTPKTPRKSGPKTGTPHTVTLS